MATLLRHIHAAALTGFLFGWAILLCGESLVASPNSPHIDRSRVSASGLLRLDAFEPQPSTVRRREGHPTPAAPSDLYSPVDPRIGPPIPIGTDPTPLPLGIRAQAEPHIARNPLRADHLIATFQEGRWTNGGAVNCGFAVSTNGGLNWSRSLLPGLTTNFGGAYRKATDPVVAFNHHGRAFINTLASVDSSFSQTQVLLSRSSPDGTQFEAPIEVFTAARKGEFADKNWMAIDRSPQSPHQGRIAISFTFFRSNGFTPILVTTSDDDGMTWSAPHPATSIDSLCQGSTPLFLPDGRLLLTYWNFGTSGDSGLYDSLEAVLSNDGGTTFGTPVRIGKVIPFDDPVARDGYFLPNAAVDSVAGQVVVTCQAWVDGSPRILFSRSKDAGVTWTALTAVSDNPKGASVFNPAVDVSPDGQRVAILFADKRANLNDGTQIHFYATASLDGGTTWLPNWRLSPTPVDLLKAPLTGGGRMIGDYFGVVAPSDNQTPLVAAIIGTDLGDPDPYAIRMGVSPTIEYAAWQAARFSVAEIVAESQAGQPTDGDEDGFTLLQEYAFGLDPCAADTATATARRVLTNEGPMIEFRHQRLRNTSDIQMVWERSELNGTWESVEPLQEAAEPASDPFTELWIVRYPLPEQSHFFRLKASLR